MIQIGDIVISPTNGEERVVLDVFDYREEEGYEETDESPDALANVGCALRYLDGDDRREQDEDGGDIYIFAERMSDLEPTGRRYDE